MAKVVYKTPNGKHCEVQLKEMTTIGRHPAQDIQILDRVVSKAHAVIEHERGNFYVRDVGSRNGTVVNEDRLVNSRHLLVEGDQIILGGSTITYHADPQPPRPNERVTFADTGPDTGIRRRFDIRDNKRFLPAKEIDDVDVLRRDYERLRIAVELAREVGLQFDLDKLLDKILEKAFQVFAVDRGVILLRDAEGKMAPSSVRSKSGKDDTDIRISQTILKEVCDERTGVLSSDAMLDSRFSGAHSIILEGIRSTMSVPLMYGDELLGVIHLDSQIATGAFTEKDLEILMGFAQQAAVNIRHNRLLADMEQNILARDKFKRLLSPHLVDDALSGRLELKMGGDKRMATVIFTDIRGFTSKTERSEPEAIVSMLNEYFEIMVEIIFGYEGTLDKFVGDEIMAVWGAPMAREDHSTRAVLCALDMLKALADLNAARARKGEEAIQIGIGVATGEMIAGYMGSTQAMDYTVIGDTVNLGSRLCSAAGPGEILINETALDHVRNAVEVMALPPVRVKGKAAPVKLYRVLSRIRTPADTTGETQSVV